MTQREILTHVFGWDRTHRYLDGNCRGCHSTSFGLCADCQELDQFLQLEPIELKPVPILSTPDTALYTGRINQPAHLDIFGGAQFSLDI